MHDGRDHGVPEARLDAVSGEQQLVVPFHQQEPRERGDHNAERGGQCELGVQAPALRRTAHAPGAHQVQQHREAEGSAESTGQDRQADRPVVDMQPGSVGGEAGIVVRHDREEQRFPQCVAHITVVDLVEAGEQCDECDAFDDECGGDDYGEHAFDFTELRSAEFVGGQHALRALSGGSRPMRSRSERHDAKATHLHGEDEHALAEGGPMRWWS